MGERPAKALGLAIKQKRVSLGLTQQLLADMAGLSPEDIDEIENGAGNLSLDSLGQLMDVLGLVLEARDPEIDRQAQGKPTRALWMAAKGANVSYSGELLAEDLEQALATRKVPPGYGAQIAQILEEAPLQLVAKVVAQVAARQNRKPEDIWQNVRSLARTLGAMRGGLWA